MYATGPRPSLCGHDDEPARSHRRRSRRRPPQPRIPRARRRVRRALVPALPRAPAGRERDPGPPHPAGAPLALDRRHGPRAAPSTSTATSTRTTWPSATPWPSTPTRPAATATACTSCCPGCFRPRPTGARWPPNSSTAAASATARPCGSRRSGPGSTRTWTMSRAQAALSAEVAHAHPDGIAGAVAVAVAAALSARGELTLDAASRADARRAGTRRSAASRADAPHHGTVEGRGPPRQRTAHPGRRHRALRAVDRHPPRGRPGGGALGDRGGPRRRRHHVRDHRGRGRGGDGDGRGAGGLAAQARAVGLRRRPGAAGGGRLLRADALDLIPIPDASKFRSQTCRTVSA